MLGKPKNGQVSWIPEIPRDHIMILGKQIRPIVRMAPLVTQHVKYSDGGGAICHRVHPKGKLGIVWGDWYDLYYIETVDLYDVSYIYDPKPTDRATSLRPLCRITTYHIWEYFAFRPSIAEVLAQIPSEHLDVVVAFEILNRTEVTDGPDRGDESLDPDYHVATTRLYMRG